MPWSGSRPQRLASASNSCTANSPVSPMPERVGIRRAVKQRHHWIFPNVACEHVSSMVSYSQSKLPKRDLPMQRPKFSFGSQSATTNCSNLFSTAFHPCPSLPPVLSRKRSPLSPISAPDLSLFIRRGLFLLGGVVSRFFFSSSCNGFFPPLPEEAAGNTGASLV
ncbi:hypothetical protein HPP92_019292 [Vanilla planifolia]|uniref:Uncharacterized protein n=1 Tax=Vanilla planifolia TaxID=51239 RepID=A0A835UKU1_VANPL|nr:hypothetical protein HPP92_019292 [Vanilla planifolia]